MFSLIGTCCKVPLCVHDVSVSTVTILECPDCSLLYARTAVERFTDTPCHQSKPIWVPFNTDGEGAYCCTATGCCSSWGADGNLIYLDAHIAYAEGFRHCV